MDKAQALDILQRISVAYPMFDLKGELGQKRIEVWLNALKNMSYEGVLNNLNQHMIENKFPPTIAEIAAFPKEKNTALVRIKQYEEQARQNPPTEKAKRQFWESMKHMFNEGEQNA